MATLSPPAPPPNRPPTKRPGGNPHWTQHLTRAGYFLGAILFHLILFLILMTAVVFRPVIPPSDEFRKTYVPTAPAPPPPPPSTAQETMQVPAKTFSTPQTVITSMGPSAPSFTVPLPDIMATPTLNPATPKPAATTPTNTLPQRLPAIKQFVLNGSGRTWDNIRESNGDPHNVVATFPVYVAAYQNGDWGCNLHLENGQIVAGSMPDLVEKINEWSHGNIKGRVEPTPLAIGGPDLASKNPPFIFFTGHKDFTLTDQEIENLRNYLENGGCIWGDNALPGSGSRFDVAFRKQMKRVLPDIDKNWEVVPPDSDIFMKSWFVINKLPEGMNHYSELIQHIDIDGKLAIIYTPNDYSDLYFMRILPGDTAIQTTYAIPGQPLYTNLSFYNNSQTFFRNFTLPAGIEAYRLGMNIVGHLLVRFDKDLMTAP